MVERKRTKGQTMIYKTLHKKPGVKSGFCGRVGSSCSTCGTRRVTIVI